MAAASAFSNTVCQAVTTCELPLHFEAVSATATSDAVCQPVTQCSIDQKQTAAPTRTTDRVCKAVAVPAVADVTHEKSLIGQSADNGSAVASLSSQTGADSSLLAGGLLGCAVAAAAVAMVARRRTVATATELKSVTNAPFSGYGTA